MNFQKNSLLDLPLEVLTEIFDYVPNKSPLKFTCWDFYNIVCSMEVKQNRLLLNEETITQYRSILRSNLAYDEVKLHFWDYKDFTVQRLVEIFKKFQGSLHKITIGFSAINYECLINLLQLLPNLHGVVIDISLIGTSPEVGQRLSNLIRLKSVTTRVETAAIIFELPKNVLSKLIFKSSVSEVAPSKQLIEMVFHNQMFIEELHFNPEKINSIEGLTLKKLWLANDHNIESLLQNQQHLRSLFFTGHGDLRYEELPILSSLDNLHTLHVRIHGDNLDAAYSIEIKNLKVLVIGLPRYDFKLHNILLPTLETLELNFLFHSENIVGFFEELPLKCPLLKKLSLISPMMMIDSHRLSCLLKNKSLENLQLLISHDVIDLHQVTTEIHTSLKQIHLGFYSPKSEILMIALCPNLEKVSIRIMNLKSLENVLKNKRLTHLRLICDHQIHVSSIDLIRLIKDSGKKLNYFELRCKNIVADDNFDSKLRQAFDAQFSKIKFSCKDGFLIMTIDFKLLSGLHSIFETFSVKWHSNWTDS